MNFKKLLKKLPLFVAGTLLIASLTACGTSTDSDTESGISATTTADVTETGIVSTGIFTYEDEFTDRDLDASYDEVAARISLADDASTADGDGVTVDGNTITISAGGTYVISGSLSDGQIIVDADDEKVQLVLDGASVTCSDSAAIYVKNADKVFVTTADGSDNSLSTTGTFEADDDTNVDGVIFAKSDLTINGSGTLNIDSSDHGIVCKDDLRITGSVLNITATGHGISGKDSIRIASSDAITIDAGTDGLHAANDEDSEKGYIYIYNADLTINSESDGLDGSYVVQIDAGSYNISAGDDGIHSETDLYINDGEITIANSYEGLEGGTVTINGGTIDITSSDDGINAASNGTSSSDSSDNSNGFGGFGGMGGGMMEGSDDYVLTINGGVTTISAEGDGVDSNGLLYINGGELYVDGPTNDGNAALDYGTTAYVYGGTVVAVGMSGMAENFSSDSTQPAMLVTFDSTGNAGDEITVTDSDGNTVLTYTTEKTYNCVLISSPDLTVGETYTVTAGDQSTTVELTSTIYGEGGGMGSMGGGMGGGMGQDRGSSDSDSSDDSGKGFPGGGSAPSGDGTAPSGDGTAPSGGSAPDGGSAPGGQAPGQNNNSSESDDSTSGTSSSSDSL